jgi:hypothetical protein
MLQRCKENVLYLQASDSYQNKKFLDENVGQKYIKQK